MKLEVGMYVRTNDGIRKVTNDWEISYVVDDYLYHDNPEGDYYIYKKEITKIVSKASNNITDLIEVGDYVNGYKITSIEEGNRKNKWVYAEDEDGYLIESFAPKKIKSIVTKEQFESCSYEVQK